MARDRGGTLLEAGKENKGSQPKQVKERVQGVGAETCKPMTTLETRVSLSLKRQQDTCKGLTVEYEKAVSTPNYIMK